MYKCFLLFLGTITLFASTSFAQWTDPNPTTMGKVGIGLAAGTVPNSDLVIYRSMSPYIHLINSTYSNSPSSLIKKGGIIFQQENADKTAGIQFAVPPNYHVPGILFSTKTAYNAPSTASTSWYDRMFIHPNGNIGIGTTAPGYKLDINTTDGFDGIQVQYLTSSFTRLYSRLGNSSFNNITMDGDAAIIFGSPSGVNAGTGGFVIAPHRSDWSGLRVTSTGMVGIGTGDTKGYRLAVAGKMIAEEVVVKLQSNWPDYVFESTYKLPMLSDLKDFITRNKHLPGVPTAEEVSEKGIEVGEMNALLLKKVEEITLYLIELEKKNEQLEERVLQLEKKLDRRSRCSSLN